MWGLLFRSTELAEDREVETQRGCRKRFIHMYGQFSNCCAADKAATLETRTHKHAHIHTHTHTQMQGVESCGEDFSFLTSHHHTDFLGTHTYREVSC